MFYFFPAGSLNDFRALHDILVVTLDPNKFTEKNQQRIRLGGLKLFQPRILKQSITRRLRLLYDCSQSGDGIEYPPDTKAFLYYSIAPGKPRIAGELRLRVASSDDFTSFESGSDLLLTNGRPWSRSLYILSKRYFPLYEKLREERLVPDDLHAVLSTFPSQSLSYRRSQLLYTLNDTFIVDFSGESILFVITEQGAKRLPFLKTFSNSRGSNATKPYTGAYIIHHLSISL